MSLLLEGDYEFAAELLEQGEGIRYPRTYDQFSVIYIDMAGGRVRVTWYDGYTSYISFSILRGLNEGDDSILILR